MADSTASNLAGESIDDTFRGVVTKQQTMVSLNQEVDDGMEVLYCEVVAPTDSDGNPPPSLQRELPFHDTKSYLLRFSEEHPPTLKYNGHTFGPSGAISTIDLWDDQGCGHETPYVHCRTSFWAPVDGNGRGRYKVYSIPHGYLESENGMATKTSQDVSLLVRDPSDRFSSVQRLPAKQDSKVIALSLDKEGQGQVWEISYENSKFWEALEKDTETWAPFPSKVTVFTRESGQE
ncbi:hypothetical protein L486_02531 [Kwoniella mangroviensis CBS 10435]|uniref:Uncharacterized protein n=1 Tax=Kwoniella mangroviensis CBS 10435 TaxID=1331196 RepID=A0A1B9IWF7_9TREE|nr:hypothetical protein L486_02531 [Kwoniella mangroviensis CBS 10435]